LALSALAALIVHVPAVTIVTVEVEIVQTPVVSEVRVGVSPEEFVTYELIEKVESPSALLVKPVKSRAIVWLPRAIDISCETEAAAE
jgi:hypothetical protein